MKMTEKEKMQGQMLYDANNDDELIQERTKTKDLEYAYPIAVGNPCKVIRRIQQSSSAPTAPTVS